MENNCERALEIRRGRAEADQAAAKSEPQAYNVYSDNEDEEIAAKPEPERVMFSDIILGDGEPLKICMLT